MPQVRRQSPLMRGAPPNSRHRRRVLEMVRHKQASLTISVVLDRQEHQAHLLPTLPPRPRPAAMDTRQALHTKACRLHLHSLHTSRIRRRRRHTLRLLPLDPQPIRHRHRDHRPRARAIILRRRLRIPAINSRVRRRHGISSRVMAVSRIGDSLRKQQRDVSREKLVVVTHGEVFGVVEFTWFIVDGNHRGHNGLVIIEVEIIKSASRGYERY